MGNIPPTAARSGPGAGAIHHDMSATEILLPLLREFLDMHCVIDAKAHVAYVDLVGAYYTFARNRGHELKMPAVFLNQGFMALMERADLAGVEKSGIQYVDEGLAVGIVYTGLRLAIYPTRDMEARRAFGVC